MASAPSKPKQQQPRRTLDEVLGHVFARPELLRLALTHRSLAYENGSAADNDPSTDNEQMEFLGDAVLGVIVTEALFHRFPLSREGELTRLRASVVGRRHLAETAARIGLGSALLLGHGEDRSGGRQKPALLANAVEAVTAALFLDGGLEAAREFVLREVLEPAMPELHAALRSGGTFTGAIGDYKSSLQELLQARSAAQLRYLPVSESGPDHQRRFQVEIRLEQEGTLSEAIASAEGASKKEAQQKAARLAMERLTGPGSETLLAAMGIAQSSHDAGARRSTGA